MISNTLKYWQIKKLGEVCGFQNGFAFKSKLFSGEGLPILRISNIQQDKISYKRLVFFKKESYDIDFEKYKVKKGDLVIAMSGATTGKLAISNVDESFYLNQRVGRFKPKKELLQHFLYYFLTTKVEESLKISQGAAQPNLSTEQIKNFQIPLPPLPEQIRITKILDEAFEKLEIAKKNAEKNLKNAKELFESYLQGVFEEDGDDWEEKKLGDKSLLEIIDGDRGKNYPKKKDFLDEGCCLFMNTKNVRPNGFKFETTMFIDKKRDELLGKGKLQRDDVVLTTRGTIGNMGLYSEDVKFDHIRINSGMLIFRVNKEKILPEYLLKIFQSGVMKNQIIEHVSGAAQPQLPIKTLIHFSIPVPKSLTTQTQIVKKLDHLSANTKKLEKIYQQKIDNLDELKKSLLQKAFRGEL